MRHSLTAVAVGAALLTLASCSSRRSSLTYFEDIATASQSGTLAEGSYDIRIVPGDVLHIYVTSSNPADAMPYNLSQSYTTMTDHATGITTTAPSGGAVPYEVSAEGNINFPVLGTLHVEGLTTSGLAEEIRTKLLDDVAEPIVNVSLENFRVNILGQVNRPGFVRAPSERFSILDALAAAGDLTPYAVRDNILLIREEDGKRTYHHLNLNDSRIFESPYFYLKQNDILVVDANDVGKGNASYNQNNAFKLSVISSITGAASVIASMVALAVKK